MARDELVAGILQATCHGCPPSPEPIADRVSRAAERLNAAAAQMSQAQELLTEARERLASARRALEKIEDLPTSIRPQRRNDCVARSMRHSATSASLVRLQIPDGLPPSISSGSMARHSSTPFQLVRRCLVRPGPGVRFALMPPCPPTARSPNDDRLPACARLSCPGDLARRHRRAAREGAPVHAGARRPHRASWSSTDPVSPRCA